MRKTLVLFLVFSLFFTFSGIAFAEKEIKDLAPGHWAYESVKLLIEKGYFSLFEDGTFRGKQSVSRYELAVVLARILENIDQKKVTVSSTDMDTLRKLTVEFRDELVQLARQQEVFQEEITALGEEDLILHEDIDKIYLEVHKMVTQIQELAEQQNEYNKKLTLVKEDLLSQLNEMKSELNNNNTNFKNLEQRLEILEEEVLYLKEKQAGMESYIQELELNIEEKKNEIKELEGQNRQKMWLLGGALALALLLNM